MDERKPFWKQEKNLWVILVVILVLIAALVLRPLWRSFRSRPSGTSEPTAGSRVPSFTLSGGLTSPRTLRPEDISAASETFRLLYEVKDVSLDFTIFDDPRFNKLESFQIEITVPPLGRPNPFLKF